MKKLTKQRSFRKTWRFNLDEESFIKKSIKGKSLNVCCGQSRLGDVRVDLDTTHSPDLVCDYMKLPYKECEFDTVIFDPPFQDYWKHQLKYGLHKVGKLASKSFILKGYWFIAPLHGFDLPEIEIFYKPNKRLMIVQIYKRIPEDMTLYIDICERMPGLWNSLDAES